MPTSRPAGFAGKKGEIGCEAADEFRKYPFHQRIGMRGFPQTFLEELGIFFPFFWGGAKMWGKCGELNPTRKSAIAPWDQASGFMILPMS
jgi:hypothetical protein